MALPFPGASDNQERSKVPTKKRNVARVEIRIDAATQRALQTLLEIYGERFTQSDIIRDAIIEKAERDAQHHKRKTTA